MIGRWLCACLALGAVAVLVLEGPTKATSPVLAQGATPAVVAIRNGTILTATRGTINNGTVLIRDGKIAAVGTNVPIPSGADVYDATGKFVSPGLIDAHSHIANDAINEGTVSVSSMTGMEDVLDPTDINIYRDLAGGTTTANILHGSANAIGGKTVVIKLRYGKRRANDLVFQGALPGIKFALGENVTRKRGQAPSNPQRFPTTRQGVEYVIRDAFTRAKAYRKEWQDYDAKKKGGQDALAPRRDLQLDALVEVLESKRLVHAHSYRADEILMLIRLADEMGFKITTFQHVLEGYKVAKEIAAHNAGASTFSDWWGYKMEAADAIPHNASLMTHKGVVVSINSDDAEQARRLNMEAAKAVRYGDVTDEQAFAMVTINPAKQLKVENRVGSIEVGKDADVVIWNHHPLSTAAIVERSYIDGVPYYDREKDLQRITEIQREKSGRSTTDSSPASTNGTQSTSNGPQTTDGSTNGSQASPRPAPAAERFDVKGNADGPTWAITNARIVTVSGPVIPKGSIVIKGNRIEAVGANVAVPAGAKPLDVQGATVIPGMIDASTDIGLNEPGVRNYDDVTEILPFDQMLRTRVAYKADSIAIPVTRSEGITTIGVRPGGGTISGEIPVMNLDGWTWEEATLRPSAGLAFNYPGGTGGRGGGGGGRGAAAPPQGPDPIKTFNQLLERARVYAKQPATRQVDWTLEPFLPVLDRRQALYVAANTEQTMRDAIALADRQNIRIVLQAGADAQKIAPLLKQRDVPVILSSILSLPPREDEFHAYPYQTPAALAKAGVTFAFSSGGFQFSRDVPFQAGRAVAWGLSHDDAIKALTLDAARILGVDGQVGSIDAGKVANLVVLTGDPLEVRSQVRHVIVAGRDVPLDNSQVELFKKYMSR
ncbi:MAG TPA: amidohydrolase family protein [Vicinamibacterales bacterium]|nr:amidohydrolase family protein [Vicinamibacterales bacterium]